jgi:hypothetical protein
MRPVYDQVLLLCPEVKTGGPEALHQLGHQIALHGGEARMVYYAPYSRLEIDGDVVRCDAAASPMPAHFAQYAPQVLRETRLTADTLVVFPEPLAKLAADAVGYRRALWWLSLDNALPQNPELGDDASAACLFADPRLLHFHQSEYAARFLRDHCAAQFFPLSDYTDPQFVHRSLVTELTPPITERRNVVCFFPNKGGALAARFLEGAASLRQPVAFVPIRDMTKAQVRATLFGARIYIDFGHHPGKDRVPREAAIAGAVVLLHAAGAARCFPDHPLAEAYRFTEADVESGALHRRIDAILDDPAAHFAAQRAYRQGILLERARFDLEVRGLFFEGAD